VNWQEPGPTSVQPFRYDPPMATSLEPVTTLRGAHVEVDSHRLARGLIGACVVALAAVTVLLFAAAVHENAQVASLRRHGVPVAVTVSRCRGVLSGSGSNAAGYSCRGTFALDGKRYSDTIPGDTLLAPGTTLRMVTVESDPGLIATIHQVEGERTSWGVFILPTVLLVVVATLVATIAVRSRRGPETASSIGTPLEAGFSDDGPH
jgi:hypothetical protein